MLDELYTCADMRVEQLHARVLATRVRHGMVYSGEAFAIARCTQRLIAKGYIRVVTRTLRAAIRAMLCAGAVQQSNGLPKVGNIDLMLSGASIMISIDKELFGEESTAEHSVYYAVEGKKGGAAYCVSRRDLVPERVPEVAFAGTAVRCGPWCGRWWRVHPTGFKLNVRWKQRNERKIM